MTSYSLVCAGIICGDCGSTRPLYDHYNLQFVGISLPLWLIAGLRIRHVALRHEGTVQSTCPPSTLPVLLAVLSALCSYWKGYGSVLRGRRAMRRQATKHRPAVLYALLVTFSRATRCDYSNNVPETARRKEAEAVLAASHEAEQRNGRMEAEDTDNEQSPAMAYRSVSSRLRYNDVTVVLAYVTALATRTIGERSMPGAEDRLAYK